jgi:hypothetical protein
MRRALLGLLLVAILPMTGCLQKDSTTTIYLHDDGTIEWGVLDQNVRSDESDAGKHLDEERGYIQAIWNGTDELTRGFRALGGRNVRTTVLRDRAPFSTRRSAGFDNMNQVWERAFEGCPIPHRLSLTTEGAVTTWTFSIQVDPWPDEPADCDKDGIEALLSNGADHLRIILESGTFVAASGFTITAPDAVEIIETDSDAVTKGNGVLTFSLTWKK